MNKLNRFLSPHSFLLAGIFLLTLGERTLAQNDTTQNHEAEKAVSWEFSTRPGADGRPVLILQAHILDGWKLYSTTMPDSLPNSRVALDSSSKATITGIEEQGKLQSAKDPLFNNVLTRFFTNDASWIVHWQPAAATAAGKLKGTDRKSVV